MTVLSLVLASTNGDKFNEPKIIKIRQLQAEIFDILILGPKTDRFTQKKCFFHFSPYKATDSLKYIKFINLRQDTVILGGICTG